MIRLHRASTKDCERIAEFLCDDQVMQLGVWGRSDIMYIPQSLLELANAQESRVYAIRYQGNTIGGVVIKGIDRWNRNAEVGVVLDSAKWGQGIGTSLGPEVRRVLFMEMGLHRVYGYTLARNQRAIKLAQRLGAEIEGRIDNFGVVDGKWEDCVILGLLARQFTAQ